MEHSTITDQGVAMVIAVVTTIVLIVVISGFVAFLRWSKRDRSAGS